MLVSSEKQKSCRFAQLLHGRRRISVMAFTIPQFTVPRRRNSMGTPCDRFYACTSIGIAAAASFMDRKEFPVLQNSSRPSLTKIAGGYSSHTSSPSTTSTSVVAISRERRLKRRRRQGAAAKTALLTAGNQNGTAI